MNLHRERCLSMPGDGLDDIALRHDAHQAPARTTHDTSSHFARRKQVADLPDRSRGLHGFDAGTFVFQDCSNSHVILPEWAAGALVTPEDRTCEPAAEANARKSAPKTAGLQLRSARRLARAGTHCDHNIRTRMSCGHAGKSWISQAAST